MCFMTSRGVGGGGGECKGGGGGGERRYGDPGGEMEG